MPVNIPSFVFTMLACTVVGAPTMADMSHGTVRSDTTVTSTILEKPVSYALYLPPGYDTDSRSYPVIYLMHGGGTGAPFDWFSLAGADTVFDRLIEEGMVPPFIAIAPDGRRDAANEVATYFMNDADGAHNWEDMFLQEFVPLMEVRYRAMSSSKSRGLLGISMGGHAAIAYTLRYPDVFAGSVSLSGAFRTAEQITALNQPAYESRYGKAWGEGLEGDARLNEAWANSDLPQVVAETDAAGFRRVPRIFIDVGADDPFFEGNADLHLDLKTAGIRHRFMVREGGHNWPYWRSGLEEAVVHLGKIFTRDYGE
ncbi:alpha/beta hydrolase [Meridianimarinicoccus aquatilis]|nr:alpha/beta hydrolase-fold protein [Fluviibacterium aquatile]